MSFTFLLYGDAFVYIDNLFLPVDQSTVVDMFPTGGAAVTGNAGFFKLDNSSYGPFNSEGLVLAKGGAKKILKAKNLEDLYV